MLPLVSRLFCSLWIVVIRNSKKLETHIIRQFLSVENPEYIQT
jgi:hypothetical protein